MIEQIEFTLEKCFELDIVVPKNKNLVIQITKMLTIKTIILSRFGKKYLEGNNGLING